MSKNSRQPEPTPAASPESPLVSNAKLRQIYTMMLHCRAFATRFAELAREGHASVELQPLAGEEALLAATSADLRSSDTVSFAQTDWLTAMLKGAPLKAICRYLDPGARGRTRAFKDVAGLRILPDNLEEQLAAGRDAALVHKRKKASLTVLYTTEGASSTAWKETLEVAGRRRLPLLIVCRTRLRNEPTEAAPVEGTLGSFAQANDIPHIFVDGRDALAVYRVAQEAMGRARRRIGATLIDCQLADSDKTFTAIDPLTAMEGHLAAKGLFSSEWKEETLARFEDQLDKAFVKAARRKKGAPARTLL